MQTHVQAKQLGDPDQLEASIDELTAKNDSSKEKNECLSRKTDVMPYGMDGLVRLGADLSLSNVCHV